MKVTNMTSPRTGRSVPNQFIIRDYGKVAFQSYESTIAEIDKKRKLVKILPAWDYSRTTAKYRNMFFDEEFPCLNSREKIKKALEEKEVEAWGNTIYKVKGVGL